MTKSTRSVRLSNVHHEFIDESSFDFGAEVREFLTTQQVQYAAGICAACGDLVYIGGHAVVSGSAPLGQALGLEQSHEIDLCDDCYDQAIDSMADADVSPPALDYLDWWNDPLLYRADRDAIADAQPEDEWATLVTDKTAFDLMSDRLRGIIAWSQATDLDARYATKQVDGDAILSALHRAVADEADLRL